MSETPSKLSRRRALAGAGTVGALAAAAVLPKGDPAPATTAAAAQPAAEAVQGEGYQVTPHVLRYYQTARV